MNYERVAEGTWDLRQSWKYKGCDGDGGCAVWCVQRGGRWSTIANELDGFGGQVYGCLEESGAFWFHRGGGDFVRQEKISGGCSGDGRRSGRVGVGIS